MLQKVSLSVKDIDKYGLILEHDMLDEVKALAADLKGLRLCHINSTPFGGGVAELLSSLIPMARGVGIAADWQVIRGDRRFFTITKSLHNALQGKAYPLIEKESTQRVYKSNNLENAKELDLDYDVFIVNDPQPAALRHFCGSCNAAWIWRCHVDSSQPDEATWHFLSPYIEEYDAVVFTMEEFVPPNLKPQLYSHRLPRIAIMAPAIDPLSTKNMAFPPTLWREMLENLDIDKGRPLVSQISRFDPWKDPFGVILSYRLAKEEVPGLQLALITSFAGDDPEAWDIYAAVHDEVKDDPDVHIFSNLTGVGNMEVNAFQTASAVVIQKSIREGFGLVVSEALWKGTPVVAGNTGGIPMQMAGNLQSYLVNSPEECAEKMAYLLKHPDIAHELGQEGMEHIRRHFLTPRLLRDELALIRSLLS
ncbi:MAG: glycosyltransferase [Chloroflexota bacterium]|nr:glycosyltransferase [Chloroflexota bacterium]